MTNKSLYSPENIIAAALLLGIFSLSIWIQTHIFLCWDIDWLIHVANRLLAGGNYYQDFFEVNSPMAIFIHIPTVLISKYSHISFAASFRIEVFLSIIVCLRLSYYLLTKLIHNDALLVKVLIICLSFALLLQPFSQFGQREHLLVIFALPYIFLIGLRCKKANIHFYLAILIGVLAAIAINIKPYFLLLWLTLECYILYQQKTWRTLIRAENVIIVITSCVYLCLIAIFTPEYVTKVLPLISKMYYLAYLNPWKIVLLNYGVFFYVICSIFYCLSRTTSTNQLLLDLCQLSATVFLVIYLYQHVAWDYHIIPPVLMCCLLSTILIYEQINKLISLPISAHWTKKFDDIIYIVINAGMFITLPFSVFYIGTTQSLAMYHDNYNQQLINFIIQHDSNQPVYFFSDNMDAYIVVDKSHTTCGSRFSSLWILNSIINLQNKPTSLQQQKMLALQKYFIRAAVVEDLNHYHPSLLFFVLNNRDLISYQTVQNKWPKSQGLSINYMDFFSVDPRFKAIMKNYSALGIMGNYQVYKHNTL